MKEATICMEDIEEIISTHFTKVKEPRKGDLVAYYNDQLAEKYGEEYRLTHTSVYKGNGMVESVWGSTKAVFLHPKFYVPEVYGNRILYFRLKSPRIDTKTEIPLK